LFRLPDYILDALKSRCFLIGYTERRPEFGIVEQELVDLDYLAMLRVVRMEGDVFWGSKWRTSISPKGKEALLDNLHPSELVALIQQGVASGYPRPAAAFVIGVPKKFLPELLSSSSIDVREAARERLDKLNGLERRTNWLAC